MVGIVPVLLAVETSAEAGSLSVVNGKDFSTRQWQKRSTHSDVVTQELMAALSAAGQTLEDLTHLAVDVGPGSFTGIRVGLNLVRSIAYALDLHVQTVSSMAVLGFQNLRPGQFAVVARPAIQNFMYAAAVQRTETGVILSTSVQSVEKNQLTAFMAKCGATEMVEPTADPTSAGLAELVLSDFKNSNFIEWKDLLPLYVRRSEAEEKLRMGVLKPPT